MSRPLFQGVETEPKPPNLRWRIAKDEEIKGQPLVMAGEAIPLYTHRVGKRTLPCLRSLPMLKMECPHCERSRNLKCWVPIINLNMNLSAPELRVVMGANTLAESAKGVKRGTIIAIKKVLHLKPTWCIFPEADQTMQVIGMGLTAKYVPERGDITRWLLHYWQWPEITRAFGEVYRESQRKRLLREEHERHQMSLMTGEEICG